MSKFAKVYDPMPSLMMAGIREFLIRSITA